MAYEQVGVAGLTVELKQTYLRRLLMRATPLLVHGKYGLKATNPRRGGKSVEWRRLDTLAATTTVLTEGTPGAATQITFVNVQATIDQFGAYVQLTDLVNTQSFDPVVAELTDVLGEQMGNSLDQVVRNIMRAGTTIQFASTGTSRQNVGSGMRMIYAEIREAVSTLERNNAKKFPDGRYRAIIHPDSKRDMFADADIQNGWQNAGMRGGENPLFTGEIGDIYGVSFVVTTNSSIIASAGLSGADIYLSLFFGQEWYGITEYEAPEAGSAEVIVKPLGSSGTSDPLNQLSTVGWKAAIQAAILNQTFGVRVEHTTTRSNAA